MERRGQKAGRQWRAALALTAAVVALSGAVAAQPPNQDPPNAPGRSRAELVGPPEFVAELKARGNDGVVRIFIDGEGAETSLKVVPRGAGICTGVVSDCAGELSFVTVGRPLSANERVVITGVSDEQCFAENVFEISAGNQPVTTGKPRGCGKGDVWMYKIEFTIDGEVVGEPIDPGVLIDTGPGT